MFVEDNAACIIIFCREYQFTNIFFAVSINSSKKILNHEKMLSLKYYMAIVFIKTNKNETTISKYYMNISFNSKQEKRMLSHYH
jgi:hypothetical protein